MSSRIIDRLCERDERFPAKQSHCLKLFFIPGNRKTFPNFIHCPIHSAIL